MLASARSEYVSTIAGTLVARGRPQTVAMADLDPQAPACYGPLLRFVDDLPVSDLTTIYLEWCHERLAARSTRVPALIWNNAACHGSRAVCAGLAHTHEPASRWPARSPENALRSGSCYVATLIGP
jgi:hypothetical protein